MEGLIKKHRFRRRDYNDAMRGGGWNWEDYHDDPIEPDTALGGDPARAKRGAKYRAPKVVKFRRARPGEGYDPNHPDEGDGVDEVLPPQAPAGFQFDAPPEVLAGRNQIVAAADVAVDYNAADMVNLDRGQDIGESNKFDYFRVRGGLSNFALLHAPVSYRERRYHVCQYPTARLESWNTSLHTQPLAPFDYSADVPRFEATDDGSNMLRIWCPNAVAWMRPHGVLAGAGPHWAGFVKILKEPYRNALNAIVLQPPNLFFLDLDDPLHKGYLYYYVLFRLNLKWAHFNVISRMDPESIGYPNQVFDTFGEYHDIRNWWPYQESCYRNSNAIRMHRVRVSGAVTCAPYQKFSSAKTADPAVSISTVAESIGFQDTHRPVVVVLLVLERNPNGKDSGLFSNNGLATFVSAIGRGLPVTDANVVISGASALPTPNVEFFMPHPAVVETYPRNTIVPFRVSDDCVVLAFDVLDMDKAGDPEARSVDTNFVSYELGDPPVPVSYREVMTSITRGSASKPFVFDVDLGGVVTNYSADSVQWALPDNAWTHYTPPIPEPNLKYNMGDPPTQLTSQSLDEMISQNALRMYSYAYYPSTPGNLGPDFFANPPRLPAWIGCVSVLEYSDLVN